MKLTNDRLTGEKAYQPILFLCAQRHHRRIPKGVASFGDLMYHLNRAEGKGDRETLLGEQVTP